MSNVLCFTKRCCNRLLIEFLRSINLTQYIHTFDREKQSHAELRKNAMLRASRATVVVDHSESFREECWAAAILERTCVSLSPSCVESLGHNADLYVEATMFVCRWVVKMSILTQTGTQSNAGGQRWWRERIDCVVRMVCVGHVRRCSESSDALVVSCVFIVVLILRN